MSTKRNSDGSAAASSSASSSSSALQQPASASTSAVPPPRRRITINLAGRLAAARPTAPSPLSRTSPPPPPAAPAKPPTPTPAATAATAAPAATVKPAADDGDSESEESEYNSEDDEEEEEPGEADGAAAAQGIGEGAQPNAEQAGSAAVGSVSTEAQSGAAAAPADAAGQVGLMGAPLKPVKKPAKQRQMKIMKRKPLREALGRLLGQIQRRDIYQFFCSPVDEAEVPGYRDVIKQPMDFGTMEGKLGSGAYRTPDEFKSDLLLVTQNSQTFNPPGTLYHNEAKKIETWALKALLRETTAAILPSEEEATAAGVEEAAQHMRAGSAKPKKSSVAPMPASSSQADSSSVAGGGGVKQKRDEMDEDDDDDDEGSDAGSSMRGSSRARSITVDRGRPSSTSTPGAGSSRMASPDAMRKIMQARASGSGKATPVRPKNKGKASALGPFGLASGPGTPGTPGTPLGLTGSTNVQLAYSADGSVYTGAMSVDEKRALLRPIGQDGPATFMLPTIEAVMPLHPNIQPQATAVARPPTEVLSAFSAAMLSEPATLSASFSHDLSEVPLDQQVSPFTTPSGWGYGAPGRDPRQPPRMPLAWPRPIDGTAADSFGDKDTGKFKVGRERAREREALGVTNLDDWSYPRAFLTRLLHPLDMGLYPGLLPANWQAHIRTSKGGSDVNRLPPYHLTTATTVEAALKDELEKVPLRALFASAAEATSAAARVPPPIDGASDIVAAIAASAARINVPRKEEISVLGARGADTMRELVWGGAEGEAYARSVAEFVEGAAWSAERRDAERVKEEEEEHKLEQLETEAQREARREELRAAERRKAQDLDKEGGFSLLLANQRPESAERETPQDATPAPEAAVEAVEAAVEQRAPLFDSELTEAVIKGVVLDRPLLQWVRDEIVSPLTGGLLDALVRAGELLHAERGNEEPPRKKARVAAQSSSDESQQGSEAAATLLALAEEIRSAAATKAEDSTQPDAAREIANALVDLAPADVPAAPAILERAHIQPLLDPAASQKRTQALEIYHSSRQPIELHALIRSATDLSNQDSQASGHMPSNASLALPLRFPDVSLDTHKVGAALAQYAQILPGLSTRAQARRARAQAPAAATSDVALKDAEEHRRDAKLWDMLRVGYIALARNVAAVHIAQPERRT